MDRYAKQKQEARKAYDKRRQIDPDVHRAVGPDLPGPGAGRWAIELRPRPCLEVNAAAPLAEGDGVVLRAAESLPGIRDAFMLEVFAFTRRLFDLAFLAVIVRQDVTLGRVIAGVLVRSHVGDAPHHRPRDQPVAEITIDPFRPAHDLSPGPARGEAKRALRLCQNQGAQNRVVLRRAHG